MNTISILYAEDEITNRRLLEIQLLNHGYKCDLAKDGAQALELFKKNDYQIIILDQYMPIFNGDVIARQIRQVNPTIPLFAITSDDNDIAKFTEAGFNEVFIKPVRGNKLIAVIERYTGQSPVPNVEQGR